jgi:uracil-DNA glycosylase family 4
MAAVPAGSGHPAEVATRQTPVARSADDVRRLAGSASSADHLDARVSVCRACPRLVEWRERVAGERRASFADQTYWGRPVPSWGPSRARVAIVGLAPAAHGGNRTGRIFTGDRSGDWLYAALHRAGLAELPTSTHAGDGQRLVDTRIVAAVHCAPPANKPTPAERDACRPWLERDLALLAPTLRAVVVLGGFAWAAVFPALAAAGYDPPRAKAAFGHGVEVPLGDAGPVVLGCYHPSQQNTFTGRLTEPMLDAVLTRAAALAR